MILVIDNYDSFSYNLVQVMGAILVGTGKERREKIKVVRNDAITLEEIDALQPSRILLSPGPGRPKDAGICEAVIKRFYKKYPILGVCLGHQAICEAFGATITYAKELMHGKQSVISIEKECKLFEGLEEKETVARYHSLVAKEDTIPSALRVIARDEIGEVMAVKHNNYEVYGVQFHPESVLTPKGAKILENFILGGEKND